MVPVAPAVVPVAAVFLGDVILAQGEVVVVLGLGVEQALDHVGKALRLGKQGGHDLGHEAGGEIAVIPEVRDVVIVRQLGVLLVDIPAVRLRGGHSAHHQMGVVVVGIGQDDFLGIAQLQALDLAVAGELALMFLLGQDHHQRHLVHAGAVIPLVGVIEPGVAGGGVDVADADVLGIDVVGGNVLVQHGLDGRVVQDGRLRLLGQGG